MVSRRLMAGIQWAVCSYLRRYWETQKEGQWTWADRLHTAWTHPSRQQRASFGSPSATEQRLEGEGRLQILLWIFHDVLLLFRDLFTFVLSSVCSLCSAWRSWQWVAGTHRLATGRCTETSCICTLWLLRTDTSASLPPPADSTSISKWLYYTAL